MPAMTGLYLAMVQQCFKKEKQEEKEKKGLSNSTSDCLNMF